MKIWIALLAAIVSLIVACGKKGAQDAEAGASKDLGAITVDVPKGWIENPPASAMRRAQFVLPRAENDREDGELVIYYFGPGQGGSVQANIERWADQFAQPDGAPSRERAKISRRQVSGMQVTIVDISGTYQAQVTPMSPERYNKPGFRMLAAIVETSEGPYFFKLVGPERTIAKWEESFHSFIDSIKSSAATGSG